MLALFHVTHMRNYWNTNDHPPTNYDDDQEECGEDCDGKKHVEEVVADDRIVLLSCLIPHKYEQIVLRIKYCCMCLCFLLWLWLHLVSHYDRRQDKAKCDSQLGRGCNPHRHTSKVKVWKCESESVKMKVWNRKCESESGERLQSSSTYIESVKVVKSCNCHRHQTFCENLSTTGDIDVSVGNNNVLIISQCLGWWHRDNYQDTNRNINVVKTFMAAMTLPMTLLIVRTNPRKVSPNSRKEQRWQQW